MGAYSSGSSEEIEALTSLLARMSRPASRSSGLHVRFSYQNGHFPTLNSFHILFLDVFPDPFVSGGKDPVPESKIRGMCWCSTEKNWRHLMFYKMVFDQFI